MAWTGNKNNPVPNFVQFGSEKINVKKVVNRAEQIRRDKDTQKDVVITLLDIDTAIKTQIDKFQLTVPSNGENIKVPVFYANPEKWVSIQIHGYIRDYQGKIQLPAMVYSRTTSDKDQTMVMFNRYLKYTVMRKYSQKNRYTPFSILVGQNVPINDVYSITMPDHMIFTYHFIVWTESIEHMNKIVERLNFEAEDYWGEKHGFRFRVKIDSFSHSNQLQTDNDRMVKTEFDLQAWGYLIPDVITTFDGTKNTTQKTFTAKKILIQEEVVPTGFDVATERDINSEKWRNQNYPNLSADEVIPTPPVVFNQDVTKENIFQTKETIQVFNQISVLINQKPSNNISWKNPPKTPNDPGEEGWIAFDDQFYYVFTSGLWKRVPAALF